MKRPLLSLFTLLFFVLPACSGETGAVDGAVKSPTTRSTSSPVPTTTRSRSPIDEIVVDPLLPELVNQGVCVIYVFIDLDWVDGEKESQIEAEVSRNLRNLGTTSARCMGGWPYVVITHDSGAQLLHPCNVPDPASDGYAALVVPGRPKGACS